MDSLELNALPTHPTLLHPRTGDPLRAVGILPNGRVVWPIMGGDGSESDANDGGTGDGNDDGANGDEGQEGDGGQEGQEGGETRPERQAARYRTQLRETETRLNALSEQHEQTQSVLQALRAALDPEGNSGEGDPAEQAAEMAAQVQTLTSEVTALRAALLVHDLADDAGANASALLDSRAFNTTLAGLDPESDTYRADVTQAMKDAVSKNAAYKAGQGSSSGGSELNGREKTKQRPKSLRDAIAGVTGG